MRRIEIAAGSVVGAHHRAAGRNNQDAYAWSASDAGVVAVVCDGCGSGAHSELGARLGATLLSRIGVSLCGRGLAPEELLAHATQRLLFRLRLFARELGDVAAEAVNDHLLFTIVGLLVDGARATTFSLGDGVVLAGGERTVLGPFAGNAPPYLGHALLGQRRALVVHATGPLASMAPLALGSDGAADLPVPLSALTSDARVFSNRDHLRRRLTVLGRAPGALSDDTTLVVARVRS
jgi:hypothetical protein